MNIADLIPQPKERKKRSAASYRKPESIKHFEKEYKVFYYKNRSIPENLQIDIKFSDKTANDLTKTICAYLKMNGHFSARVNTQGNYSKKLDRFIYSGSTRGMADITAIINGKHISIEVKVGRDKIRESQEKTKEQIEQAGGVYLIARSFDDFLTQINAI